MTNAKVYSALKAYVSRLHDVLSMRRNKKTKPRLVISAPFDFKKEDSTCILPGISGEELYMLREKAAASIVGSALTHPYETYSDSATLAPSSVHDLHFGSGGLNRSTSSFDKYSLHRLHHNQPGSLKNNNSTGHLPKSLTAPVPVPSLTRNMTSSSACSSPTVHHMMMALPTPTSPVRSGSPTVHVSPHHHNCCRRCKSAAVKEQHQQRIGGGVTFYPPIVLASTEPYAPTGLSFPSSSSSASSISSRD
ncbi:hypothetical protein SCUCBS95973_003418 [Sporothrix curviconia]|uniref:Uncharacterized protein n=1 Tax=Sporothrix curviconia TaxID=1260050 RepID=A0ABP0BGC6_9PEZI